MLDITAKTTAFCVVRSIPDSVLGLRLMHAMALAQPRSRPRNGHAQKARIEHRSGAGFVEATIVRPATVNGLLPIVVHLHGGGYAIGHPRQDIGLFELLIETAPCIIIAPHYRRSLEAPYPAALNDCYDALVWARDKAGALGGRSDQIIVMGESAGGGLAASLCLAARDRGEVSIAAQLPLYAMLDDRTQSTDLDPMNLTWTFAKNKLAWNLYLGSMDDVPPYAAPAHVTDLSGLPPAFGLIGGQDLFCNENKEYFECLATDGVRTRFETVPGAYHGVEVFAPKSGSGLAVRSIISEYFANAVASCYAAQDRT